MASFGAISDNTRLVHGSDANWVTIADGDALTLIDALGALVTGDALVTGHPTSGIAGRRSARSRAVRVAAGVAGVFMTNVGGDAFLLHQLASLFTVQYPVQDRGPAVIVAGLNSLTWLSRVPRWRGASSIAPDRLHLTQGIGRLGTSLAADRD